MPTRPIKTLDLFYYDDCEGVYVSAKPICGVKICEEGLRRWFDVPLSANWITLKLYAKPVYESVRVHARVDAYDARVDASDAARIYWHNGEQWKRGDPIYPKFASWLDAGGWLSVEYEEASSNAG